MHENIKQNPKFYLDILEKADLLLNSDQVQDILDLIAKKLKDEFSEKMPLFLVLMKGGYFFASELLKRLDFPLELDYLEASRYGKNTTGACLTWLHKPATSFENRHIILLDDVFDEGITLEAVYNYLQKQNIASIKTLVLIEKQVENRRTNFLPDLAGASLPNRFLFGCGMDISGYWRNLPQIYAMAD